MLKRLAIASFLVVLAAATVRLLEGQSAPLSTPKQGITKPDTGQNGREQPNPQNTQQSAQPRAASGEPSAPTCDENCQHERENLGIQRKVEWFTGVLAGVGILQGFLLYLTWKTIRRQADMQQAGLMQWVDIQPIGILVHTKSKSDPPERVALTLRWRVLNNTSLPFTVRGIEIHILKGPTEEINVVEEVEVIPPAKTDSRNFYPFFVETDLDREETKQFLESGILITVQIEIYYVDATGEEKDRFFGDHYFCKKDTLTLGGEHLGKTPKKRIEKDDRPNTMRTGPGRYIKWEETAGSPQDGVKPN